MIQNISWTIPQNILQDPEYTKINIYGGTDENNESSYTLLETIDRWVDGDMEKEVDSYAINSSKSYFYVRYLKTNGTQSKILLTVFNLTPKQLRWVEMLRKMLDPIITSDILADGTMRPMTDTDLMLGIYTALGFWNTYSPTTDFVIANFPKEHETMLMMWAQYFTLMNKMLGLSLRDFTYSDNGLSLSQQFSPAIQNAMDKILGFLNPLMQKTKMEFSLGNAGYLGSTQFAIGLNGRMGTFPIDMFSLIRGLQMN